MLLNFPNINLPDSVNDEPHSHGYVQYKVKRKNNLPIGTQIRNTAYIYFDFNSPVQTNTTVNTLTVPVAVTELRTLKIVFSIYPNPLSGNILNIYFKSSSKKGVLTIYEMSGRSVYSSLVNSSEQSQQIVLHNLTPGIYQCILKDGISFAHQKLVIVH